MTHVIIEDDFVNDVITDDNSFDGNIYLNRTSLLNVEDLTKFKPSDYKFYEQLDIDDIDERQTKQDDALFNTILDIVEGLDLDDQ